MIPECSVGGAERQLLELIKGLDKARFEVILLTLVPGGALEPEFRAIPGVELQYLKRKGRYDLLCLLKIMRILRSRKVDVVQPFLTPANLYGILAGVMARTPVRIMTRRPGIEPAEAPMRYRLYFKAEDVLARLADWVVPNSAAGAEYALGKGIGRERIKVIGNGVNVARLADSVLPAEEARQRLGLPSSGGVVGTIARLVPFKSHDVLLHAAVQVQREMPDTKFVIVGDGPLRNSLESLAQQLGLSSSVVFFGEQRNIGLYLSSFDVAVLPSYREGCSNFILEAMTVGKPVVASDVIGNRHTVSHNETGLLVEPRSAGPLADSILTLLRDPELAKSMGQAARGKAAAEFSLANMVRQYEALYRETLGRKGVRRGSSVAARDG
jgi:glycosyltransferase involved in cell wall biosynthesis